jgi:predicted dehydrogenase
MDREKINRRKFLKNSAATAAAVLGFPYIIPSKVLGKNGQVAPSNKIIIGAIGVGNRGAGVLRNFMYQKDAQVVAVCDVKTDVREKLQREINEYYGSKGCAAYNDYKELLGRSDIDAVLIASTDHWHVLHAVDTARAGKDIYLEKPIGLSIEQAQVLRKTIKKYGRVFQLGTQQRSDANFRFACELVLNGRIGKVHTIKVGAPGGLFSENYPIMPVPQGLDYQRWLGPAPQVPYTQKRVTNFWWWHISDYALGFVAGWGIHHIDIAQWGNGTELSGPLEVEGTGVFPKDGLCDCATTWDVNLKYANGVTLNFTDNTKNKQGVVFEGTEGWVYVRRGFIETQPASILNERIGPNEIHLPVSNHHQRNLLDCIKRRDRTVNPIESAVCSEIICHLSDIAMRIGRKLKWNPQQEKFLNDDQANRMLTRSMRSPWYL